MEYNFFTNLGFSKAEIDIYIAILKNGPCKTGIIIEKTGLVSSTIYHLMSKLLERGVISFVFEGGQKVYQAEPPEVFEGLLEAYKKQYSPIKKELNKIATDGKVSQKASVYRGIKGLYAAMNDILTTLKRGDEYYFLQIQGEYLYQHKDFLRNYHQRREDKGIKVKGIYNKELRAFFKENFKGFKKAKLKETTHPYMPGIIIYADKVLIFDFSETPTIFVLQSKVIHASYKKYFENIWKMTN